MVCECTPTKAHNEIVMELKGREYNLYYHEMKSKNNIEIRTSTKTLINENDFKLICSLDKNIDLYFSSSDPPKNYSEDFSFCANKLKKLSIFSINLVNDFYCNLWKIANLEKLDLDQVNLSDSALTCLGKIKELKSLYITGSSVEERFPSNQFTDEGFCSFARSGIKIKHLEVHVTDMTQKGLDCITEIKDLDRFSFNMWRNFDEAEIMKIEEKFLKRNGRPLRAGTFQYERY